MTIGQNPRTLLLQWDGADLLILKEMAALGRLPNVQALMERSVTAPLRGTRSPVAAAVSTATGVMPCDHGLLTDIIPDSKAVGGLRRVVSVDWASQALWSRLSNAGLSTHAINWPVSHPAQRLTGSSVSNRFFEDVPVRMDDPWPLKEGSVGPNDGLDVFDRCRIHPAEIDGESVVSFLPLAPEIDPTADVRLAQCAALIAEASSIHAATLWTLENRPWDFAALYYPGLDHFSEPFMTYRSPQLASTSDRDLALYGQAVDAAYGFHDLMLGAILNLVGDDVTVVLVSGFGYHTGGTRPIKPSSNLQGMLSLRRPNGFVLAAGPEAEAFASPAVQSITDLAPAIVSLFGVSGEPTETPRHEMQSTTRQTENLNDCDGVLRRYGYVANSSDDVLEARTCFTRDYHLLEAQALMDAKRFAEAEVRLEDLAADFPEAVDIGTALAFCQFSLEHFAACRKTIEGSMDRGVKTALGYLGLAAIALSDRNPDAARAFLGNAEDLRRDNPSWLTMEGQLYARLGEWDTARQVFDQALSLDPDNADAFTGLATVSLGQKNPEDAIEFALQAIALNHLNAVSHYRLGVALSQCSRAEEAVIPFENALVIDPDMLVAHRRLNQIYQYRLNDPVKAVEHQLAAEGARRIKMSLAEAGAE